MLVANGHRPCDLESYAVDKLRLMFELAQARLVKDTAGQALMNLRTTSTATAAAMHKKNHGKLRKMEAELMQVLESGAQPMKDGTMPTQNQAIAAIVSKLTRRG